MFEATGCEKSVVAKQPTLAACKACKHAKVKCEKMHPCNRCERLNLHCVVMTKGRGRPNKKAKGPPPPSATETRRSAGDRASRGPRGPICHDTPATESYGSPEGRRASIEDLDEAVCPDSPTWASSIEAFTSSSELEKEFPCIELYTSTLCDDGDSLWSAPPSSDWEPEENKWTQPSAHRNVSHVDPTHAPAIGSSPHAPTIEPTAIGPNAPAIGGNAVVVRQSQAASPRVGMPELMTHSHVKSEGSVDEGPALLQPQQLLTAGDSVSHTHAHDLTHTHTNAVSHTHAHMYVKAEVCERGKRARDDDDATSNECRSEDTPNRSELLMQLLSNPLARKAQDCAMMVSMARALSALRRENLVDLQKLRAVMRAQAIAVLKFRNEGMQGLLDLLSSVVGMGWTDPLEEGDMLEAQRCVSVGLRDDSDVLPKALEQAYSVIGPWRNDHSPSSMLSYFVMVKGETRLCCDERFTKAYIREDAEVRDVNVAQTCPFYFWGRVVAPEDQPVFFMSLARALYGTTPVTPSMDGSAPVGAAANGSGRDTSFVVKCVAPTGLEILSVGRVRVLFSSLGLACALSLSHLPQATHVPPPTTTTTHLDAIGQMSAKPVDGIGLNAKPVEMIGQISSEPIGMVMASTNESPVGAPQVSHAHVGVQMLVNGGSGGVDMSQQRQQQQQQYLPPQSVGRGTSHATTSTHHHNHRQQQQPQQQMSDCLSLPHSATPTSSGNSPSLPRGLKRPAPPTDTHPHLHPPSPSLQPVCVPASASASACTHTHTHTAPPHPASSSSSTTSASLTVQLTAYAPPPAFVRQQTSCHSQQQQQQQQQQQTSHAYMPQQQHQQQPTTGGVGMGGASCSPSQQQQQQPHHHHQGRAYASNGPPPQQQQQQQQACVASSAGSSTSSSTATTTAQSRYSWAHGGEYVPAHIMPTQQQQQPAKAALQVSPLLQQQSLQHHKALSYAPTNPALPYTLPPPPLPTTTTTSPRLAPTFTATHSLHHHHQQPGVMVSHTQPPEPQPHTAHVYPHPWSIPHSYTPSAATSYIHQQAYGQQQPADPIVEELLYQGLMQTDGQIAR